MILQMLQLQKEYWLVGKKWEKLIEKYTTAIARVTKRKKRIKVYDIEYWRNGGQKQWLCYKGSGA